MSPVLGCPPLDPVAVCTTFVSALCQTIDCPAQMVTLSVVCAVLQFTRIGDESTVSWAVPEAPPAVAVIATGPPRATPRARPFASTVAMAVLELLQVTGAGLPRASFAIAANWIVVQRGIVADEGVTETEATACCTTTEKPGAGFATWFEVALATTCAVPLPLAVTRPPPSTVATAGGSLAPARGPPPRWARPARQAGAATVSVG